MLQRGNFDKERVERENLGQEKGSSSKHQQDVVEKKS
jgi:hypothetical protein